MNIYSNPKIQSCIFELESDQILLYNLSRWLVVLDLGIMAESSVRNGNSRPKWSLTFVNQVEDNGLKLLLAITSDFSSLKGMEASEGRTIIMSA